MTKDEALALVKEHLDLLVLEVAARARREALEEAARICDDETLPGPGEEGASECARQIRALLDDESREVRPGDTVRLEVSPDEPEGSYWRRYHGRTGVVSRVVRSAVVAVSIDGRRVGWPKSRVVLVSRKSET